MEGLRYHAQYLRRDSPKLAGHLYISSSRDIENRGPIVLPYTELYLSCWDIIEGMFKVRLKDSAAAPRYWVPAQHILSTWTSFVRYVPDTAWNHRPMQLKLKRLEIWSNDGTRELLKGEDAAVFDDVVRGKTAEGYRRYTYLP